MSQSTNFIQTASCLRFLSPKGMIDTLSQGQDFEFEFLPMDRFKGYNLRAIPLREGLKLSNLISVEVKYHKLKMCDPIIDLKYPNQKYFMRLIPEASSPESEQEAKDLLEMYQVLQQRFTKTVALYPLNVDRTANAWIPQSLESVKIMCPITCKGAPALDVEAFNNGSKGPIVLNIPKGWCMESTNPDYEGGLFGLTLQLYNRRASRKRTSGGPLSKRRRTAETETETETETPVLETDTTHETVLLEA